MHAQPAALSSSVRTAPYFEECQCQVEGRSGAEFGWEVQMVSFLGSGERGL